MSVRIVLVKKRLFFMLFFALFAAPGYCDATFDNLFSSGKFKEAIDYADEKIAPSDRDSKLWVHLGQANDALGMPEKALACFLVSWRINPTDYNALLGASKIYNKMEQSENALNMAKKALEISFTAEASWEYARACIALNRSAEAKSALEKVIQADSSNVIANRELGNIYFAEKSWKQSIPLLKKTYKKSQDAEIAYKIGKAYIDVAAPDSAVLYLKNAVAKGNFPEAALDLALAYYGQKNYKAAVTEFSKLQMASLTAENVFKLAVAKEKNQDFSGALEGYEIAVQKFGNSISTDALTSREKLGKAKLKGNYFDQALRLFQDIATTDPNGLTVPDIYFLLAEAFQGLGNKDKAIASLEKAIALNNRNVEAYARLAELYQKNGMEEKAKTTYESLLSLSPNDPNVYLALGLHNLKVKKFSDALSQFEKSNTLRRSAAAMEGIASAAYNINQIDKARDAAKAALGLDGGSWNARVILAEILMKDKNFRAAQEHLEFIVQKESFQVEYLEQLAVCYLQNKEIDKLADVDKKIASLNRANTESRMRLAKYADSKNDVSMGLTYYGELAVLTPNAPEVFHRLYELSLKKGAKSDCISYLKKYIQLNSTDAEAHRDLGDLLYDNNDLDGALEMYRTALKLNPAIKGFYKRYAEIVIAKGQQDEVISAFTTIIQAGEADLGTYTTLGMIFQKKKIFTRAIEMYQKALLLEPSNIDALTALAACQAADGDPNGAVISYEQVVMMSNQLSTEYKELGEIYMRLGREEEAAKAFKKYLDKVPTDADIARIIGKRAYDRKEYADAVKYLEPLGFDGALEYVVMYSEACFFVNNFKGTINSIEAIKGAKKIKGTMQYQIYKMLAEAYEKDSNSIASVKAYRDYLLLPGVKDPDAAYKLAFLQEISDSAGAIKLYEDNTRIYPADYRNFLRLGLIYSSKKETLQKAISMLMKVTDLASSVPVVWLELGRVYRKMGKAAEELLAYKKYAESEPQNLEATQRIGILLMLKGLTNEALVYLEMANALSPNDFDVMAMLAKGYLKSNRSNEAVELLYKAKKIKNDDPGIRFQLFDLYQKLGQDEKALNEIKELVELKREPFYLLIYANELTEQGKLKDAENVLEDVFATDGENVDAFLMKAKILRVKKKYDDAVEVYKEILIFSPEHPKVLYERAETHLLQQKLPWAETFYTRALRVDPSMAVAELGLAKLAKLKKDMASYKMHLEKARLLAPENELILEEIKESQK